MHDLSRRATSARELMDSPDVDLSTLERTYARFRMVNAVVGGWRGVYRRELRPRALGRVLRVLDVGCGGGDVARALLRWARRDGVGMRVLGIDPDPRAIDWAERRPPMPGLMLRRASSADLLDERFDVVLSNHVLHHLEPEGLELLLADSIRVLRPGGLALHVDLARGRAAYLAFGAATLPLQTTVLAGSLVRPDGLTSIRRAYTAPELAEALPGGWAVRRAFPARLHARWEDRDG